MKMLLTLLALTALQLGAVSQTPCGTNGVTVSMNPPVALPGQLIQITLTNDSAETINLPTACNFGAIYPGSVCAGTPVFTPLCLQVITTVFPGQSVTSLWLQTDDMGLQVPNGIYSFALSYWNADMSAQFTCCAPVAISNVCAAASSASRNGTGVNPQTLTGLSVPRLGSVWSTSLDCSANAPGPALVFVFQQAGNGPVTSLGEILVSGSRVVRFLQGHTGGPTAFSALVPTDLSLCGRLATAQGACLGAPGPQLSNALDLVLGS